MKISIINTDYGKIKVFFALVANGWQYDQWRIAGDITVNRYKTLSGADTFKLPPRPPLVILRVCAQHEHGHTLAVGSE
jgi:hypothetical protein